MRTGVGRWSDKPLADGLVSGPRALVLQTTEGIVTHKTLRSYQVKALNRLVQGHPVTGLFSFTANVGEVLDTLKFNLQEHREIVVEAEVGYLLKCKELLTGAIAKLTASLNLISDGYQVPMSAIHFSVEPPQDHSKDFLIAIKMLELHRNAGETVIDLKAFDVQRFLLNEWPWTGHFILSNSSYSGKPMTQAAIGLL